MANKQTNNPVEESPHFVAIEKAAKSLRAARDTLTDRATHLNDDLEAAKRRAMRGLKASVADVSQAQAELLAAVEAGAALFVSPRSMVLHGVKLGLAKGKGKIDWEDDAKVVKLIRKHQADAFDVLVKTTEEPIKAALSNLSVAELKALGVTVESTGDVPFARDTTAGVDKLIKALLKGAEEEASV